MPLVALVDGKPALALDDNTLRATCRDPQCAAPMYRRAGKGMVPHWSHTPGTAERCDAERDISKWHLDWQMRCGDLNRIEARVGNRRADVLTCFGWAVEFQHSGIARDTAHGREDDWQGQLIWVHDGGAETSGQITVTERWSTGRVRFDWVAPPPRVGFSRCHQLVDLRDGTLLWLAPRELPRGGRDIEGAIAWACTEEQFTDWWLLGAEPVFPTAWAASRWQSEQKQPPPTRAAPKPRSARLQEALADAQLEHELGAEDATCERAFRQWIADGKPGSPGAEARPCVDCGPHPRSHRHAALMHGQSLCDEHWAVAFA